jgi:hypothetical protein
MFVKVVLLVTFFGEFLNMFFDTFFDLKLKFLLRSYYYFFQTLKPNAQKMAPKIKNVSIKCVLDLNFAPIKGSVFLTFFFLSQIRCTLLGSPLRTFPLSPEPLIQQVIDLVQVTPFHNPRPCSTFLINQMSCKRCLFSPHFLITSYNELCTFLPMSGRQL